MSNKIQSDKKIRMCLVIGKKKKKTGRLENKNVFGFHLFKIRIHILLLFYNEDTCILIIEKKKKNKELNRVDTNLTQSTLK